jgi:DHA2 family methylenomycin A resistance protein-like MFS transporter
MEAAPDDRGGAASAVFNAARQVGSAVGVALLGTLVAHRFIPGLHAGVVAGGIGFFAASIIAALFIRPPRRTA